MPRELTRRLVAGILAASLVATAADAQPAAQPAPGTPSARSQAEPAAGSGDHERFLALDVFGGAHPQAATTTGPGAPATTFGWELGSTVRFVRWMGVSAAVGRVRTPERAWITHVQAGPRVSAPLGRVTDLRVFAHVAGGRASARLASGLASRSLEIMAGGGLDAFNVFRIQLDVVRRDLTGFPRRDTRFLFGVALPFCFSQCTTSDGFDVSRAPR